MSLLTALESKLQNLPENQIAKNVGYIKTYRDGVAYAVGLSEVAYNELVEIHISEENVILAQFLTLNKIR